MKDSLDILQTYNESIEENYYDEPVYVVHDSLNILRTDVICHHGILGMKWGIRRYQNKDGSLTPAGMKRYYKFPNEKGALGTVLTPHGKRAFRDKHGQWKNDVAGQAAKARHEENVKIQDDVNKKAAEKVANQVENLKRLNKEYTLEQSKYSDYKYYKKTSPKEKKRQYEITIDADDVSKKIDFKKYDDFEKNSDTILKQCENMAYEEISDWLKGMDSTRSREDVIKSFDRPSVWFDQDHDLATVTYYSPDIEHFPSVEYDIKNKKVYPSSVDG